MIFLVNKEECLFNSEIDIERLYLRVANLVFECSYGEKISVYDTDEQLEAKLGVVKRFNQEIIDTCNLDEICTLI